MEKGKEKVAYKISQLFTHFKANNRFFVKLNNNNNNNINMMCLIYKKTYITKFKAARYTSYSI
jgi:hypothetical protein